MELTVSVDVENLVPKKDFLQKSQESEKIRLQAYFNNCNVGFDLASGELYTVKPVTYI